MIIIINNILICEICGLAIYGNPSESEPWAWGFGGHHLGINMTIVSNRVYLSPTFLGIEPASFTNFAGENLTPLNSIPEKAVSLYNTLDANQQQESQTSNRPRDMYAGAGKDGVIPSLEGSPVISWNEQQKENLLVLIREWVLLMPKNFADARMEEVMASADQLYFTWYGNSSNLKNLYFRIQSSADDLLIEFSVQGAMSSSQNKGHYHSVYRNPSNEYGMAEVN